MEALHRVGHVDAEGGPLIIGDADVLRAWKGICDDGQDYQRACALFDASPEVEGAEVSVGAGRAFLWEMRGAGTADVFSMPSGEVLVVRVWLNDPRDEPSVIGLAAMPATESLVLGKIEVPSLEICVLWATQDGQERKRLTVKSGARKLVCMHEVVETAGGRARRLRLAVEGAPPATRS